jgi:3-hydroxy-9,10-secoandrosta-1,3,5(10)-triene-9,17-dione monooxygenase reductase component
MTTSDPQRLPLGKAIGRIPSGVFILTAQHAGRRGAIMASWVQQASFMPPALSIALAKGRAIADAIRASQKLALSILPEDDKSLMKHYARPIPDDSDPFAGVKVIDSPGGSPILADALAWLDCRVIHTCDFGGDHELFLAEIIDGQILKEGKPFMHVRGNGFHY